MNINYQKISFEKLTKYSDSDNINYLIIRGEEITSGISSSSESFILEGFFFGICTNGSARVKINFKEYYITPNKILNLAPNQVITFIEKSENFIMESLYVSPQFLMTLPIPKDFLLFLQINKYPCIQVSNVIMQNLLDYYAFIEQKHKKTDPKHRDNIIKGIIFSMIMELHAIYKINNENEVYNISSRQEEIVNKFFKLLVKNYNTERSVAFYADKLCITPKYLSTTIKQATGRSVLSWIHEIFIINSKALLKSTNKTVSEISEELNMSNDSFFCRTFKKHTGMSPLEYRKLA